MSLEDKRRRSFLLAGATALTGGLAGCTGLLEESELEDGDENGTATSTPTAAPTATPEPIDLPVEGEATRIEYGASVSGELTGSAPSDPQFEGYYQPYTFVGSAGDVVQISMTSPGGDPYLFLLDEQGNVLEENDDADGLNSAISGFELPSDGGYVILAGSFDDTVDFEYELSLTQVQSDLRSIAVGETLTGTIDSSDPQSSRFNGYHEPVSLEVGSEMSVNISMSSADGDTYLYVLDPDDNVIAQNDDFSGLNSFILNLALPEAGEYTIVATSFDPNATFTYELSVSDATATRSISVGETLQGELSTDDAHNPSLNGYYDFVDLDVAGDVTVDIEMSSADGDTLLAVLDADSNVVAVNDDAGTSLDSRISRLFVGANSDYTILATSFSVDATFSYELSVTESEPLPDLRSISIGQTRTGGVDRNDPNESRFNGYYEPVTFEGSAGQYVDIEMTSERGDTYLYLLDTDGQVVAENDDTAASLNSRVEYQLTETGEYTIIATSYDTEATFMYELTVREGSAPIDLRSISVGEQRTGELDNGDPNEDRFNGYYEPVTLQADAGQFLEIEMTSEQGDTYLYLLDPDGNVVAQNDDYEGFNSLIEYETSQSGEFTIIATSFTSGALFEYELSVLAGAAPTDLRSISVGQTRTGELDPSDPQSSAFNGYYEPVSLSVDSTTTVNIEMNSDGDTYLFLLDANDQIIAENDDYNGLNAAITGLTLDAGDYTIIATSFSSRATFEYELSVYTA
ncbi:PPC domain-containing protein [Haloarchaeobius baliensis]|uniref:PPC domain-containing protein n=1 Tax=Haloarchaeobius baliensis TaxID=1670458 RepID=UPI003F882332